MELAHFLRTVFALLRPRWFRCIWIFLGLLLEMAFYAGVPLSFKFLIDRAIIGQNREVLLYTVCGLGASVCVVSLAGVGRDYLYARLVPEMIGDLRLRVFSHLQRLSMSFYARAQVGDLLSRFSGDAASIEVAMSSAIPWGILPGLDVICSACLLCYLDWRLALVASLVCPASIIGPRIFAPKAMSASHLKKQDEAVTLTTVQENLFAQPVVKAFGLERHFWDMFVGRNLQLFRSGMRVNFISSLLERSSYIGVMLVQVLVVGVGASMAFKGTITVGTLAAFQALFLSMSSSISSVTQYAPSLFQAAASMARLEEILRERPQVTNVDEVSPLPRLSTEITFENVTFGYAPGQESLTGVNLTIPAGHAVAFVGSSGSGKSTILNLIMKFYDPDQGAVRFDGVDLRTVTESSLRSQMGVVFQESILFDTSVRENLHLGRLGATDEQIEAAAQSAEIHEFILGLPEGYGTSIGERGGRFSGGQRQRMALARALLRDPDILILDEATSALDPATEAAVNETLARVGKDRTVITVTHRLATVVQADRIFVLSKGQVVEQGRHDELLSMNGVYAGLWRKQSGFVINQEGNHADVDVERLRALPILEKLGEPLLEEIAELFVTEQHPKDRVVVYEGDPGDRFYIIVRGSVTVLKATPDGEQKPVAVLQDGDYFGEIALLRSVPRTATIRTLTPCVFLSLQREQFSYLISRADHLRQSMEEILRERLGPQVAPRETR